MTAALIPIGLQAGGRIFDKVHMIYSDVEKVGRSLSTEIQRGGIFPHYVLKCSWM